MVCISNKEITRELHVKPEWPCGGSLQRCWGEGQANTQNCFPVIY